MGKMGFWKGIAQVAHLNYRSFHSAPNRPVRTRQAGFPSGERIWERWGESSGDVPTDAHAPNVALTAYFPEERRAGDIWELGDPLRQVRLKGVQFGRNGGSGEPIFGRAIVGG
jgi:hypothetical protein